MFGICWSMPCSKWKVCFSDHVPFAACIAHNSFGIDSNASGCSRCYRCAARNLYITKDRSGWRRRSMKKKKKWASYIWRRSPKDDEALLHTQTHSKNDSNEWTMMWSISRHARIFWSTAKYCGLSKRTEQYVHWIAHRLGSQPYAVRTVVVLFTGRAFNWKMDTLKARIHFVMRPSPLAAKNE